MCGGVSCRLFHHRCLSFGLLLFLAEGPSLLFVAIHSVNWESDAFDPNPGPFVLSPMWVSGSQPSSHWQIIQKKTTTRRLDEPSLSWLEPKKQTVCLVSLQAKWTQMRPNKKTERKKNPSESCQYILIFCLAEKQRLDTPSHCLENNFTPRSNLTYRRRAPHRLRRGNWSLKGDFRRMTAARRGRAKKKKNHHHKINSWKSLQSNWNAKLKGNFLTGCLNVSAGALQSKIRIQPTTLEQHQVLLSASK